jgi:putative phage-type endonuclease
VTAAVDQNVAPLWPGGPVKLAPHGLPRNQWLGVRKRGIGGSDVGGILGLDPRNSPLSVYMDKRGELPDDDSGEAAEWGNLLEPVVAAKWAGDHHMHVWSPGVLAHPDRPWQIANPDRLFLDPQQAVGPDKPVWEKGEAPTGLLEVKTTNQYLDSDWDPDADRMPDRARLQVQHYLDVTGLRLAHVACLVGGQQLKVFVETYDAELAEMLRDACDRFWHDNVLAGRPPAVDGSQATADLLGRLYDVPVEDVTVLDPAEIGPLVREREAAKAELKTAEARVRLAENRLKDLLGNHQVGVVDGAPVVTWKQQERAGYEVGPTTFRALRIPKRALEIL